MLGVYTRALLGFYRKRAKALGYRDGRTGTVTVIQRFGGALNLNVHFHRLAVDGVFVREPDGSLSFAAAEAPTDREIEVLLDLIRKRILRLLVRRGLLCDEAGESLDEPEAPPLHALYAASVRQRIAVGRRAGATVLRLGDAPTTKPAEPKRRRQARLGGFDLHADTSVRATNRPKLERLCRYLLRPPVTAKKTASSPTSPKTWPAANASTPNPTPLPNSQRPHFLKTSPPPNNPPPTSSAHSTPGPKTTSTSPLELTRPRSRARFGASGEGRVPRRGASEAQTPRRVMRLVVAPEAFDDLASAAGYIAQHNPPAAARLVDRVLEVLDLLTEGALDGPRRTLSSGLEVRSWPVPPLRIASFPGNGKR